MNTADLPPREKVRAHCAGAFAILGAEYDSMAPIWREAGRKDRLFLLHMAGIQPTPDELRFDSLDSWRSGMAAKAWPELPFVFREKIRAGLQRFGAWAARLGAVQ